MSPRSLYHTGAMSLPKAVNGAGVALFLVAAALQWNDPDPLPWIAIYAAAAAACALWRRWRHAGWWAAAVATASIAWAAAIAASMPAWVAPAQLFEPMERYGGAVEMGREIVGLGIVALWMTALVATARPRRPRSG